MIKEIIKIKNLSKEFFFNKTKITILENNNFSLFQGDIVSISGPSGSGKSTFLNILGLLDSSFEGDYYFLGENTKSINISKKNTIRNESIGFVHQFFHLIPELNILENVSLPNLINHNNKKQSNLLSIDILNNFGLKDKIYSKPSNLSGGEKQRVAIARALINKPDLIIADEMTGNLDEKTSDSVFDFFLKQIKINNQTLVYVTHNKKYAIKAINQYEISNKQLIKIK